MKLKVAEVVADTIIEGLKLNLEFWPEPGTEQFNALSKSQQDKALIYFEKDNRRIERIRVLMKP